MLLLVLVLLSLGSMLLTPALVFTDTGLRSKQVQTELLQEQYTRDAGTEFAMWQLLYGGTAALLTQEGQETNPATVNLNGVTATVVIRLQAELGGTAIGGAEDNRIRVTKTVECDEDGDGFDDDCLTLPENVPGMQARYTVFLDQVSPDTSAGVVAVYDELPKGFDWNPALNPVVSQDGSFPEIETITSVNIESQQNQIWKWDFSASPISFVQGQVRQFTFTAEINKNKGEYCNRGFLKMEALPHEQSGPTARVRVLGGPEEGCDSGGTQVAKYVDQLMARPNVTTIFTYIVSVENLDKNSSHATFIKDVLPQGGFQYCSPSFPPADPLLSCDPPKYKLADQPFDPQTGSFTDVIGFTDMADPAQTYRPSDDRWELFWDGPGGSGWNVAQAGQPQDNFIMRFQAQVTPTSSGSYYNEIFADVTCSAPSKLIAEGVTSQQEYCASYSWPTGGVIVPSYDVRAISGGTSAQGNVVVDWSGAFNTAQLNSWHVN